MKTLPRLISNGKLEELQNFEPGPLGETGDYLEARLNPNELCWKPHLGQVQVLESLARFKVVGCGRRWGKTYYALMTLIEIAMLDPGPYLWAAPFYSELTAVSNLIHEILPISFIKKKAMNAVHGSQPVFSYIELPSGAVINFRSTKNKDSLRGDKYKGAVIDEAPTVTNYAIQNEIMPSLMDYEGWVLFIGSPKGRGLFYKNYLRGQDLEANPLWKSWQQSSYMNTIENGGYLKRSEIDIIAADLDYLVKRQEIWAQFIHEEGAVFRNIDAMIRGSTGPAQEGRIYSIGADLGKTINFTVLTAMDQTGLVRGWERFRKFDWVYQTDRIESFWKRYPGYVWIDSSGLGSPIFDMLVKKGIQVMPYNFDTKSVGVLISKLQIGCDELRYWLPPELTILHNELKAFEYKINQRTKHVKYSAPEGLHDDCVMSLGLSNHGLPWSQKPRVRRGRVN